MNYKVIEKNDKYILIEIIDNFKFNRGIFDTIEELEYFIKDEQKKTDEEIKRRTNNFWSNLKMKRDE